MYTILITVLAIYLLVSIIQGKINLLEKISFTFLVSLGIYGIVPFLLREYVNIDYQKSPIYILYTILFVATVWSIIFIKNKGLSILIDNLKFVRISKYELLFILFGFIAVLRGYFVPVRGWDAYSLYDARGRFYEYGMKQSDMNKFSDYDEANNAYYFSYPPMTSSIHAVLYGAGFQSPTFIYTLLYFLLLSISYLFVSRKNMSIIETLLFIVPIAFSRLMVGQVYSSYTNLPMICFQVGSVYFAVKYFERKQNYLVIFSALLLGFSNWTRAIEPTYVSFLIFSIFLIFYNKNYKIINKIILSITYLVISLLPRIIWSKYVLLTSGANNEIAPSITKLIFSLFDSLYLTNIIEVAFFVYRSLFSMQNYIVLFVVILIMLCFVEIKKQDQKLIVYSLATLIASLYVIMVIGTLYFSVTFVWWKEIPGSFLRSNLVLIPLILILSSRFIASFYSKNDE